MLLAKVCAQKCCRQITIIYHLSGSLTMRLQTVTMMILSRSSAFVIDFLFYSLKSLHQCVFFFTSGLFNLPCDSLLHPHQFHLVSLVFCSTLCWSLLLLPVCLLTLLLLTSCAARAPLCLFVLFIPLFGFLSFVGIWTFVACFFFVSAFSYYKLIFIIDLTCLPFPCTSTTDEY